MICVFIHGLQCRSDALRVNNPTLETLVDAVIDAYNSYTKEDLLRTHAILNVVYREVLANAGRNQYQIPHTTKVTARENAGENPIDDIVPINLLQIARDVIIG